MTLLTALIGLVVLGSDAPATAALPKTARDVEGTYMLWSGFAVTKYGFEPAGKLTIRSAFDHPGGQTWSASWSFEDGVVHASIPYASGGKRFIAPVLFVPIAWGDRLLLVNAEELFEGDLLGNMKRVGSPIPVTPPRRFGDEKTDLRVPTRARSAEAKLPRIYGAPKAPPPYDTLLDGLSR